jgi:hypothetical protein
MAVLGLLLLAWAMLPFVIAESGPKGFDVISPLAFWSLMAASAGLTYAAWRSFKAAVAACVRWALGIAVVTVTTLLVGWNTVRKPTGAQPVGGGWHIVTDSPGAEPRHAFYRRATIGYSRVDAEVSWFRLVDGDCLVYAHEHLSGDVWAVCGDLERVQVFEPSLTRSSEATEVGVTLTDFEYSEASVQTKTFADIAAVARQQAARSN